jgi:Putative transposase
LRLKRPFSDGTWAVEMDELSLCARLAALVPPPWQNQLRYSGVLAPASKWRSGIVPKPAPEPTLAEQHGCDHDALTSEPDRSAQRTVPKGKGCRYWPWRVLKARTFGQATTKCSHCAGELTLRAVVQDRESIHGILNHLGLPTEVPKFAPARGPPYYRGRVRRIRHSGAQQDLLS